MKDYKEAIENIMADTTNKVINHAISAYNKGYADGFGKAQTDSYVKGYEDGKADTPFTDTEEAEEKAYNRGLNEAWEAAGKLYKISSDDFSKLFEMKSPYFDFSIQEVLAKIKEYEDKQFAVGDEVYSDAFDDKGIVTHITEDGNCVAIISSGSSMMKVNIHNLYKTGRHFDEIKNVLDQMGEVDG